VECRSEDDEERNRGSLQSVRAIKTQDSWDISRTSVMNISVIPNAPIRLIAHMTS
jgi:hypothetical protein